MADSSGGSGGGAYTRTSSTGRTTGRSSTGSRINVAAR